MNDIFWMQEALQSDTLELLPLMQDDFDELFALAGDWKVWEQHPASNRYELPVFKLFFKEALESKGAYKIKLRKSGETIGCTRYYNLTFDPPTIFIGFTFLGLRFWNKGYNQDLKRIMVDHAFKYVDGINFHVGENNKRSQQSLVKFGAVKTGEETVQYDKKQVVNFLYSLKKPSIQYNGFKLPLVNNKGIQFPYCMKKILLIQTAFIGDLILSTVLIENLRKSYPNAEIDFLVKKGNEELLVQHPHLRRVFSWDKRNGKYKNLLNLRKQIRNERYDYVINVQRFAATGFLAASSNASTIIGYNKNPLSFLFTKRVPHALGMENDTVHETERCNQLIESIATTSVTRPRLYPTAEDLAKVEQFKKGKYLVIAPGSIWFTKQVPVEKWISLIKRLPDRLSILFVGSSKETVLAERIMSAFPDRPNIKSLTGKLSLLQTAALMKDALFNLVNDSAPLHLASSMNAPVIAFYCSTSTGFGFTPLSDESYIIEADKSLECRPCGTHGKPACPKGHFACGNLLDMPRAATLIMLKLAELQKAKSDQYASTHKKETEKWQEAIPVVHY